MMEQLEARLDHLERRNRRLLQAVVTLCFLMIAAPLGVAGFAAAARADQASSDTLRVREIAIVDAKGVVRARLGGDLPDAVINGRRVGRGGQKVAGLMLYDGSGQERGGYVTFEPSGNVGLTLDSKQDQTSSLVAFPNGGSFLQLQHKGEMLELRSDSDGSRLTSLRNGAIVQQVPQLTTMPAKSCAAYKEALPRVSLAQVRGFCQSRFPAETCAKCLGKG